MFKCTKCVNYYKHTLKGLVGIYLIPCLFLTAGVISSLKSDIQYKELNMEKKILRKVIFVLMAVIGGLINLTVKSRFESLEHLFNQVLTVIAVNLSIVTILLLPILILRCMEADCTWDYIYPSTTDYQISEIRDGSYSNLSMNSSISVVKSKSKNKNKSKNNNSDEIDEIDPYRLSQIEEVSESREFTRQSTSKD